MEDVLAIIFLFGGGIIVLLAYSPVGRALADRVRGRRDVDTAAAVRHEELTDSLDSVRREVAELAERVDFTERLLAQRAPNALAPGAGGPSGRH